jgi:hypothetical protein
MAGERAWKEVVQFVDRNSPEVDLDAKSERILDRMLYTAHGACRIPDGVEMELAIMIYRMVAACMAAPDNDVTEEAMTRMRM